MSAWDPGAALNGLMDRFARPCIRILRPFPPPRSPKGRSKFGGLPNLPPDIEWPCGRSHHRTAPQRTPLHFLAQIDCSELPYCGDLLPQSGMLYFFANMHDHGAWDGKPPDDYRRVLYAPRVAPDQAVRQPPADMPELAEGGTLERIYPEGYFVGHAPNDPLTRKIYFEWPVTFVVADSYPATEAVRKTYDWRQLEASWRARASADDSFRSEYGDESGLLDFYGEESRDRMGRNFFAASRTTPPPGFEDYQPLRRRWREIDEAMQGAFPPTALFASEIAGAVDRYLVDRIDWAMRNHQSVAAPAQDMPMTGTGGPLGRVFGRRAPSPPPPPPPLRETPVWIEDLQIVRHEAQEWLSHLRALPDDHLLGANARERFLAWLDDLLDRCWMRIEGHQPKMIQYVGYPFDLAMFQLARLAASRETIRAHFPDDVYRMYASASFQGGAGWHQMLGWFSSSQEPKPIDDPMIPLLMLSYDRCPDFRICDVGEMQFFIREGDLRAREFSAVQVQMQGG